MLWFAQELEQIIKTHAIQAIVIKRSEGRTKSGAFEQRAEYEGVVYMAAGRCGLTAVSKKVKSTLAKDLGLKGRAHYLETLNTTPIADYDDKTDKEQEAILCAWSELN